MLKVLFATALTLLLASTTVSPTRAAAVQTAGATSEREPDSFVTRHSLESPSGELAYTAIAGETFIYDEVAKLLRSPPISAPTTSFRGKVRMGCGPFSIPTHPDTLT